MPRKFFKTQSLKHKIKKPLYTIEGKMHLNVRGFGFLSPIDSSKKDIFIPADQVRGAVSGDIVLVEVYHKGSSKRGPEGVVKKIITRSTTELYGIITEVSPLLAFVPFLKNSSTVHVQHEKKLNVGDRVLLLVADWGDEETLISATVKEVLGNVEIPQSDYQAVLKEFSLEDTFPNAVLQEIEKLPNEVLKKDYANRKDYTHLECVTIDPTTAKDFDDALSISTDEQGHFHLGVHIADVSYYVHPNSHLDSVAAERCNSTYFPGGKCIPMLPPQLSENLCSLVENQPRLTVSVSMEFDSSGVLLNYSVDRAVIRSRKRLTYAEARKILNGDNPSSPFVSILKTLSTLGSLLKKQRGYRGSVDFSIPELILHFEDDFGIPTHVTFEEYDITHQMVEEFMLKTNEIIAEHLSFLSPLLYRVHEEPSRDTLAVFDQFARILGHKLPPEPQKHDYQNLFSNLPAGNDKNLLAVAFIRCMKLAFYTVKNMGHFGLSLEKYCHFTSPIRRYSDVITLRLLFQEIPLPKEEELEKIAKKCSEKERNSFRAESTMRNLKKYRLLRRWFETHPDKTYSAVISKVKRDGVVFTLEALQLDGFIPISGLSADVLYYKHRQGAIVSKKSGTVFSMGKKFLVALNSIDLIHLNASWSLCK